MTYRLICGDALDVLPTLTEKIDAVITDPPYGINIINGGGRGMDGWRNYKIHGDWDKSRPSKELFDLLLEMKIPLVIWGGNYFTDYLPPSSQWFIWDKCQRDFSLADCEMAWGNQNKSARIFSYPRAAMIKENGLHPTQKPIALMKWCIDLLSNPGDTILDPFCGSGTTGVACIETGRNFIGIDISAEYIRLSERRLQGARIPLPGINERTKND